MKRIGFIVERRYLRQDMPGAAIRALAKRGVASDVICPQDGRFDPATGVLRSGDGATFKLDDYAVIVTRNRNALGLAMLSYADAAGILAINTHASTRQVRNKAKMGIALSQAGVQCARTVLADNIAALAELEPDWFPLILKATYGDNSQGLRLVRRPEDLAYIRWGDQLVLAQHYLPNDGFDLKLYVVGRQVFVVRKPSPFNGDPNVLPELVKPGEQMIDIALRCGTAFGLEIYGVDSMDTPEGLVVIEVNEYPNFTGVPTAAEHIADYILARLDGAAQQSLSDADRVSFAAVAA